MPLSSRINNAEKEHDPAVADKTLPPSTKMMTWNDRLDQEQDPSGLFFAVTAAEAEEFAEAKRRLGELQNQLAHAQKLETVGRLACGIAHDLNNLLTVVLGYTEEALGTAEKRSVKELLQQALAAGERAASLTHRLLTFGSSEPMQSRWFDLVAASEDMMRLLARVIDKKISFVMDSFSSPLVVEGDRSQIDQILANLVINARDAMPDGGHVRVSVQPGRLSEGEAEGIGLSGGGEYAVIEVTDTGAGIPESILPMIFDPLFTTKEAGKGTGLGLSIARDIVSGHRGAIGVKSSPGEGTIFTVYLPLAAEAVTEGQDDDPSRR